MKSFGVGFLLISLAALLEAKIGGKLLRNIRPADPQTSNVPEAQWFEQCLDHFDKSDKTSWKQKYYVRNEFYNEGGPVFLFLEGEVELFSDTIDLYAGTGYAKNLNGIVFALEHRFYGQSRPTSVLNFENLRYLSVEQALQDIACFINGMNLQYKFPESTRWIVLGGSYAGQLAAWARAKFPDLVYASVAYSAPVKAKLNFWEYKEHVQIVLRAFDENCLNNVKQAQAEVTEAVSRSENLADLKQTFQLCNPIDQSNPQEVKRFVASLALTFCSIVQNKNLWDITLKDTCALMANQSLGNHIKRYSKVTAIIMNAKGEKCMDVSYGEYIKKSKSLSWESEIADGDIQWDHQVCTEFGLFQTSYLKTHLFSDTILLDYFIKKCTDLFGDKFTEKYIGDGVDRTNQAYGGSDAKTTRVVYINGEEDPWMTLGITTPTVTESPVILVKGASHAICLYGVPDDASVEVKLACKQVEEVVTIWSKEESQTTYVSRNTV